MNVPDDLKIFSLIYEVRIWIEFPLYAVWITGGLYFLFHLKKVFFLWLLIFPLILAPLHIALVYSGWYYRMELYNRFAKTPQGWHDIDNMPPEIHAEYAKNGYHPRARDIKAVICGTVLLTPALYAAGAVAFAGLSICRKSAFRRPRVSSRPTPEHKP